MQPLIISYSGIRGIIGESLTEAVAARYGRAFGELLQARHGDRAVVLLGRDTRPSGPELQAGIARGLAGAARLIDLGVVPTPTVQFAMGALGAHGAVCVTASHNPAEWNGFKFFLGPDNTVLGSAEIAELCAAAADEGADPGGPAADAEDRRSEAIRLHVDRVCGIVDAARIRARGYRVAVDSAGGAGAEPTRALLEALGCQVVEVKSARESEPVAEALTELQAAVRAGACDLGLAQDLDADRLALVTEDGQAPGEETTLVMAIAHLLRRFATGRRVVVKNVATTRAIDDLASRHGAILIETPVGEINLSRALLDEVRRGVTAFGGEGNGGVIFPPVSPGRDSLVGAALVLEAMASDGRRLSHQLADLPRYHMVKSRAALAPTIRLDEVIAAIQATHPHATASHVDGLKMSLPDGSWFVVRPSNTEPVVRLVAESAVPGWAELTVASLAGRLRQA